MIYRKLPGGVVNKKVKPQAARLLIAKRFVNFPHHLIYQRTCLIKMVIYYQTKFENSQFQTGI